MSKNAKEKDDLDFFYLGEKNANKTIQHNKKETPKKKKSKKEENKQENFENEIIIGLKRVEDKPTQKPGKKTNLNNNHLIDKENKINKENKQARKNKTVTKTSTNKKTNKKTRNATERNKKVNKQNTNQNANNRSNRNINSIQEIEIREKLYNNEQNKKYETPQEIEKKRKKRKKAFKIIKIFCILIALIGGGAYFLLSPIFNIKEISVTGNSKIMSEEILSLSQLNKEENTFKINKKEVIENIKQNAYIDTVKISRTLPDKLNISVTERTATYQIAYMNLYMLINNQGYMLEQTEKNTSLPEITNFTTQSEDIKTGARLCTKDLEKLTDVLKIVESAKANNIDTYITQIDISDKEDYQVRMESQKKTIHMGDTTNLATKMSYVKNIIQQEEEEGEIFVNTDLENKGAIFRKKV